jgi:hypothetical protein
MLASGLITQLPNPAVGVYHPLEPGANADVLDNEYQVTPADWAE